MTTDMRALVIVAKYYSIIPTLIIACFYTVIDDVWAAITVICVCWILTLIAVLLMSIGDPLKGRDS
jgi:hypothetical protein